MKLFEHVDRSSQVLSQVVYLVQDKVHVLPADLRTDDNHPEEVGLAPMGLIAHHHAALLHHALFDDWSHLQAQRGIAAVTDNTSTEVTELYETMPYIVQLLPELWVFKNVP